MPDSMVIPVLLRISAITIRCSLYVLHMDIAFLMQVSQYPREAFESFPDIKRLFILGVGFVRDLDIEVKAVLLLLAEKPTADHPAIVIDEINRNCRHFPFLF